MGSIPFHAESESSSFHTVILTQNLKQPEVSNREKGETMTVADIFRKYKYVLIVVLKLCMCYASCLKLQTFKREKESFCQSILICSAYIKSLFSR